MLALAVMMVGLQNVHGQTDSGLTRFGVQADVSVGYNIHISDFRRIDPRFPSCCATFTIGSGIGPSVGASITYDLGTTLANEPIRIGTRVSWMDLSASFVEDEFISYVIRGSTFSEGISRHTVTASYGVMGIEPFVSARPLTSLPLRVRLGGMIGVPLGPAFSQQEELVEPTNAGVTFDDGSRTRNVFSGDLPDASTQVFATIAASWPLMFQSGLEISPEIGYQFGLTNMTSSLQWSASSLRLGASVRYAIPKPPLPPPPPPPPPPVVEPRVPTLSSRIVFATEADTLVVPMIRRMVVKTAYDAPSVLFFEANSTTPLVGETERDRLQQRTIEAVREAMASNASLRVTIVGSAAADEPAVLARERFLWAIRQLGVDAARIAVRTENPAMPGDSVLLDEHRSVTFLLNDRPAVLAATESYQSETLVPGRVEFAHVMTCDTTCQQSVVGDLDGTPLLLSGSGPTYSVTLDTAMIGHGSGRLRISSSVNVGAFLVEDRQERILKAGYYDSTVTLRRVVDSFVTGASLARILCYFDFNSSALLNVNERELDVVRAALRTGSEVTLVASTDNIGTVESNKGLARKRAEAVAELLGADASRIRFETIVTQDEVNRTPMGRVGNRCVRAIIKERR
ncbi:MAG: OmpA family [Bacteroidota bacterium]|jgi:hypothetical protein